ncbi:MAG: hypothetical protein DMG13_29440 [Acidobacteria bacterium]|nr:MAG: hypothetical protein DMG13_29440 [Acidobacteriota bacterium]
MLKIDFYGLRSAEDENDAPVDTLFGSVTFDDEGELKADPAAAEHQTLFDNLLQDPIRLNGKSIDPAEDPERWIRNAYQFYTGYMLRATKPVQSRRSMVDHPVDLLWRALLGVAPYPPGVEPVSERIRGTAFFPGGHGLWMPDPMIGPPDMPIGKVMVVGQDFHSLRNYKESLSLGCSIRNATWRNLLPLLKAAGIRPNDCFFTNAYMGVRSDERSTGRFPGSRDDAFTKRCHRFFLV